MYIRYVRLEQVSLKKTKADNENPSMYYIHRERRPIACLVGGYVDGEPFVSVATCHDNDNFSRKMGRTIAMGRFDLKVEGKIPSKYRKHIVPEIEKFYEFLASKILQTVEV